MPATAVQGDMADIGRYGIGRGVFSIWTDMGKEKHLMAPKRHCLGKVDGNPFTPPFAKAKAETAYSNA